MIITCHFTHTIIKCILLHHFIRSLTNAAAILAAAGLSLKNVVKTTVFLADMADFAAMNEVYAQFFSAPFPARSAVAVKTLPKGALVEIECIAAE